MSAPRFIVLNCGEETAALIAHHPNAFLLLTQIAIRAKWKDCPITGLKAGQAFIGDWHEAGLKSEKAYRHAKTILSNCGLVAFRGASKGTVATLENSTIFSISKDNRGGQEGEQGADKGRARGGQGATNHTDTQIHGNNTHSQPRHEVEAKESKRTTYQNGNQMVLPGTDEPSRKKPSTRKERGTLDELRAYALEIKLEAADGEACFDKWEGNGWKNDGKPIADWKATMRSWKSYGYHASQKRGGGFPSTPQNDPKPGTIVANGQAYRTP